MKGGVSAVDHLLRNTLQVLHTAVVMLPAERSSEERLVWVDMMLDALDRYERSIERLDAETDPAAGLPDVWPDRSRWADPAEKRRAPD
jgi:hypothetical protein